MADNILTKDRENADLDIAAKEIGAVKFPRNILADPAGNDITPASEATLAALNVIATAVQSAMDAINAKTTAVNTGAIAGTVDVSGELVEAIQALRMTVQSLSRSIGLLVPDTAGRMRAVIETGSTVSVSALPTLAAVTTVATVSALTNQVNVGGYAANDMIPAVLNIGAGNLRNNILVT